MAKQINVFLDNRPGRLKSVAEVLAQNNINVRTMTLNDRGEYGLMKLIVDKPEKAYLALSENHFACALKEILAILVEDKPGSFFKIASVFDKHNINILDAYGYVVESGKEAVLCIEVKDIPRIKEIVEKEGFKVLEEDQIHEL